MTTFDRVKNVVIEQLGVNEGEITLDVTFQEDLGADSLDMVELMMFLEEEFGIEIPEKDAGKAKTIRDVVDYIENKIEGERS